MRKNDEMSNKEKLHNHILSLEEISLQVDLSHLALEHSILADLYEKSRLKIIYFKDQYGLISLDLPDLNPINLDLIASLKQIKQNYLKLGFNKDPLIKALKPKEELIIDATAGFLGDSLKLIALGNKVVAVEKNLVIYLFLQLNLLKANLRNQLELIFAEAQSLSIVSGNKVLFDPMFEQTRKGATNREMSMLHSDIEALELEKVNQLALEKLLEQKPRLVVVKRALKAPLILPTPHHQIHSKLLRFDVYYP